MITLFYISLAFFILGISAITLKYGIPASISESYYLLPKTIRLFVFYVWTIAVALPFVVFWLDISKGTAQAFVFFGCIFLVGVGAAAPFKEIGQTQKIHITCAILCALLTQIWIFIYTPFWIFTLSLTILFFTFGLRTKGALEDGKTSINSMTFFLELACFISCYIAVYGYYRLQSS